MTLSLSLSLSLSAFKNKWMILPSVYIFFLIAYMLNSIINMLILLKTV